MAINTLNDIESKSTIKLLMAHIIGTENFQSIIIIHVTVMCHVK